MCCSNYNILHSFSCCFVPKASSETRCCGQFYGSLIKLGHWPDAARRETIGEDPSQFSCDGPHSWAASDGCSRAAGSMFVRQIEHPLFGQHTADFV